MQQHLDHARRAAVFEVWPEHWHAVRALQLMQDQWRVVAGPGGLLYLGLDFAALPPVLQATRHVEHALPIERLLPLLQRLATHARAALNEH